MILTLRNRLYMARQWFYVPEKVFIINLGDLSNRNIQVGPFVSYPPLGEMGIGHIYLF